MRDLPVPDPKPTDWPWIAVVAAVALAACLAGLRNEFAQDDLVMIAQNGRVHDLANWRELLTLPYWPPPYPQDLYRPLTSLLLAVEYALGGGGPLLYRAVSALLYAATAVGVLLLARRLLPRGIATFVALLFAAHPVHVEAVALGVSQNELLVGLAALAMTIRYVERRRTGAGLLGPGDWAFLAGLYLAAALFKEHGLVLPGLLLAAELTLIAGPAGPRIRRLWAGYGLLATIAVLLLLLRSQLFPGNLAGTFIADALRGQSGSGRALTMLQVVPRWLRLLVWPAHLQADYSPLEVVASDGLGAPQLLGLGLLLGAAALAWLARRRAPLVSFGLLWMAVALLPVSNVLIPTGIVLAERTLFLPSMGFVLALGGLLATFGPIRAPASRALRAGLALAGGVLLVAGVARSVERQGTWRSDAEYAIRTAQDAPKSWRAQRAAGAAFFQARRAEEALDAYQRGLELAPAADRWQVRNDLARRLFEVAEDSLAVEQLRQSLAESPEQVETRQYLVLGLLTLGQYARAADAADSALAHGGPPEVFRELRVLADSAARVGAPAGSIRVRVLPAPVGGPPR